jgi:UDP-glucose 4-epimerase
MTRFLLSLDQAVDTIFAAMKGAKRGEMYIPRVPSARVVDIAKILIGDRKIDMVTTGIRPGEKLHEILVSEEEMFRTVDRGGYYVILPILPELLGTEDGERSLKEEFSSASNVMDRASLEKLFRKNKLMVEDVPVIEGDLLR